MADALGYFEEEGIDATVEGADGSSFVVGQVAADSADFGIATADPVLLGYASSPNFQIVYDLLTGNVFDLWTPSDSGVTGLADLKDKVVAVKDLSGGEFPGLEVALTKAGLTPGTDVTIQPVGEEPAIQAETLKNGTADAFMVSWNSLIGVKDALAAEGVELTCLTCDASTSLGSEGIVAPSSSHRREPGPRRGIGRALAKATLFARDEPAGGPRDPQGREPRRAGRSRLRDQVLRRCPRHHGAAGPRQPLRPDRPGRLGPLDGAAAGPQRPQRPRRAGRP